MRDLAKSMMRFSLAAGAFGASQAAAWVNPGRSRESSPGLDAVTWATQGELGEVLQAAFQAGDDLQDEWTEILGDTMRPWRWRQTAFELAERSMTALRFASPGSQGDLSRQELRNKLEVYALVKGVRKFIDLPPEGQLFALQPAVEQATQLDAYRALWVIEGLGHDYVANALRRVDRPTGLLQGEAVADLPPNSLPMLHGGLGLASAEHVLEGLAPDCSAAHAAAAIERFVGLCRDNAIERYADSAIEAFGLDARCFFPDLVPALERGFKLLGNRLLHRYFWHGIGRALYFLPVNFIPGYGSLWRAIGMVERESLHQLARDNALAGVSYAFTMVNMSHPAILERVLSDHGAALSGTPFVDGLVAAVLMRQEITPNAAVLRDFIDYQPAPKMAATWLTLVGRPCRRALGLDASGNEEPTEVAEVYRALPRSGVEA